MNINLRDYKKTSEDDKKATFKGKDGHEITVAKHVLSPMMRKEISKLPVYKADGGAVSADDVSNLTSSKEVNAPVSQEPQQAADAPHDAASAAQKPVSITINNGGAQPAAQPDPNFTNGTFDFNKFAVNNPGTSPENKLAAAKNMMSPAYPPNQDKMMAERSAAMADSKALSDHNAAMQYNEMAAQRGLPQIPVPDAPVAPGVVQQQVNPQAQMQAQQAQALQQMQQPQAAPQQQSMSDPYSQMMTQFQKGLNQQKQGYADEANAMGQQGKLQAQAYDDAIKDQKTQVQAFQQEKAGLDQERQKFQADLGEHIDPNRYVNGMSTGKKITTAIGMLLGGLMGANTGKMLNDLITRDIDAQREDKSNQKSLLNANLQQYQNMDHAAEMTRVMTNDIVAKQINNAAAKTMDPLAKARAEQAIGALNSQSSQTLGQMAMNRSMMQLATSTGTTGAAQDEDAVMTQRLNALRVLSPATAKSYEERYVPGVGLASVPVNDKVREELAARQELQDSVADLRAFAQKHQGTVMDRSVVNEGKTKAKLVQDKYRRANGQGVFREGEAKFVNSIVEEDPTSLFNKYSVDPKYKALEEDNMNSLNSIKRAHGLKTEFRPKGMTPFEGRP